MPAATLIAATMQENTAAVLDSARHVFLDLEALERVASAHNWRRMTTDPEGKAWIRGDLAREPQDQHIVSCWSAAVARTLAMGGRAGFTLAEARDADLVAALPVARQARTELIARLTEVQAEY